MGCHRDYVLRSQQIKFVVAQLCFKFCGDGSGRDRRVRQNSWCGLNGSVCAMRFIFVTLTDLLVRTIVRPTGKSKIRFHEISGSHVRFINIDDRCVATSRHRARVVQLLLVLVVIRPLFLGEFPEHVVAEAERRTYICLVPEHLVRDGIRFSRIVYDQTFVVLGTLGPFILVLS